MKKETLLFVAVGVIALFLIGMMISQGGRGRSRTAAPPPSSMAPLADLQQNIKTLERIVAADPANRQAWVQLGNFFFQADQPLKSVEAYDKALALQADDPDVITDQGTMFRRLGMYDRALANFIRANQVNPRHPQSLFNQGVVLRFDLNDFARAEEVWRRYLELHPGDQRSAQIRQELESMHSNFQQMR